MRTPQVTKVETFRKLTSVLIAMMRVGSFCFALLLLGSTSAALGSKPAQKLARRGYFGLATRANPAGLEVVQVVHGGSGETMGVQKGDILLKGNGSSLKVPADFVSLARKLSAGDNVDLVVSKDGKERTIHGKMVGRPMQTDDALDVIYDQVESNGKQIRVIITKPKGEGPFPAFFLIGGIGGYSVDGNFSSILYGNVLDPIAHAGYVTVRIDKPGQGDSQGPIYPELTFKTELDAYVRAAKYAETLSFVDKKRVAIYGHSMGGAFAPLVGTQVPVKAVIANGTLFQPFTEYMLENTRRQSELAHQDQDLLNDDQAKLAQVCHYLFVDGLTVKQLKDRHKELQPFLNNTFPSGETFSGVGIAFFRELSQTNLAGAWKSSSGDALAIYGENDFLSGRSDHERLVEWVNHLRPNTAKLIILKNTDHAFRETTSMENSFVTWSQPGSKLNDSIVTTLLDYLKSELG